MRLCIPFYELAACGTRAGVFRSVGLGQYSIPNVSDYFELHCIAVARAPYCFPYMHSGTLVIAHAYSCFYTVVLYTRLERSGRGAAVAAQPLIG